MDLTVLKKKISSYRTPKGRITSLPDELLGEILHAWEQWKGISSGFYTAIGADHRKMASLIGRAKKLKREGVFDGLEFTEVEVENAETRTISSQDFKTTCGIELIWENDKIIRFSNSDLLLEFLRKAA